MRFVYIGPPGEQVERNFHGLTGWWITGEPRLIEDAEAIAWLRRHPHWRVVIDGEAEEVAPVVRRLPGRPRKAS